MIEYGGSVCATAVPRFAVVRAVPPLAYETVVTAPAAGVNPAYESDTCAAFCGLLLVSMTFRPPVLFRTACTVTDELPEDDLTMVSPGFASAVSERMPQ